VGRQNKVMTLGELNNFFLCVFGEATQAVDELHLFDRVAAGLKKAGLTDQISKALGTGDRHIETIAGKKKFEIARHIFAARRRH